MPLDQATRNRLQRFVTDARELLTDEFTRQLQQDYGMDPQAGTVADIATLSHLDDANLETAQLLRDIRAHYLGVQSGSSSKVQKDILTRIAREQAFTVLNRLAALRMMEARGLLRESIAKDYQSDGFSLYARLAGPALGDKGETYRCYLFSVFDEFAGELPQLFDRYSPHGRLFPRDTVLLELLAFINDQDLELLWAEDETIGWIYQYFNSKDERKEMRKSAAPRNSRELAVRNQFFTPRYVVEFLVDNSLGRAWFDWTGGQTELYDRCQYLLSKPNDAPALPGLTLRDPRGVKLLDPACGSMHFGLYAFDLFEVMYGEAWEWEQVNGPSSLMSDETYLPLQQVYADKEALLLDVPRLIIEYNIYGVDIDSRATQIASLALWLRAQRSWHDTGIKAKDRPAVGQGHVIAAVAPPAEPELREQMAASLDANDAKLFEETLKLLKSLPELGVLLRTEQEIPHLIRTIYGDAGDMFAEEDMERWQQAESRLRDALEGFMNAAQVTYQGHMFAQDALEGLRLMDLVRETFDVVVMNPPFGAPSKATKKYLKENYSGQYNDLYSCFVERSLRDLCSGYSAQITSHTFLTYGSFAKFRKNVIYEKSHIEVCADFGLGVMDDAMVRSAAYVLFCKPEVATTSTFFRLLNEENKENALRLSLKAFAEEAPSKDTYQVNQTLFADVGEGSLAYWINQKTISRFRGGKFSELAGDARLGVQTANNEQFLRLAWEIDPTISGNDGWRWYLKGGGFSKYYTNIHLIIDWRDDGQHIAESYGQSVRLRDVSQYQRAGLNYPLINEFGINVGILPTGAVFDNGSPSVYPLDSIDPYVLLGLINSRFAELCFRCLTSTRHWQVGYLRQVPWIEPTAEAAKNIRKKVVEAVAIQRSLMSETETSPDFSGPSWLEDSLCKPLVGAIELFEHRKLDKEVRLIELDYELDCLANSVFSVADEELATVEVVVGRHPCELPSISSSGADGWKYHKVSMFPIDTMAWEKKIHPRALLSDEGYLEGINDPAVPARNLFSFFFGVAFGRWDVGACLNKSGKDVLTADFDSLPWLPPGRLERKPLEYLVDDPFSHNDIINRIKEVIGSIYGDRAESVEQELCDILGVQEIRDYLRGRSGFFKQHINAYSKSKRRAPIYWPLSLPTENYTIWVYGPSVTDQTLFSIINDCVEPKLAAVSAEIATLNSRRAADPEDQKKLSVLSSLSGDLIEFKYGLTEVANAYKPKIEDGLKVCAAPLARFFNDGSWSDYLEQVWQDLEEGVFDWTHLAYSYWPARVREKCKTDKPLAIAHGLEDLYEEPGA
jgi:hypothetical protein